MPLKRIFLLMLLLMLVAGLSSCSSPPEEGLRFGLSSAPINLDPRYATDAASSRINRLLYQQLVDFDESYNPVPALATWQQLTATHYRFQLRQSIQFHNGAPLTALDVKATYESILNPATASPHRAGFKLIESIDVIDDVTVDFKLSKADILFPGRLVVGIMPMQKLAEQHPFNRQPLGSGPFVFESWPEEGILHLRHQLNKQRLSFIEVKNPTVRVLKLLRGEIDMLQNDLPSELVAHLSEQSELQVIKGQGSNFTYLGFNLQDPLTSNLKVRQAIAHALDRPAIIDYVLGDAAVPASALLPPDHWAGGQLPLLTYDPDKARALLKEAGYSENIRPKLIYKTSSDPFRIRLATVIQQQLSEVGIEVDLRSYDWGTFYGDIKAGRFQMYSLSWVGIKMPDIFHYVFHSQSVPPDGANRGRYFDKVTDGLIENADAATDIEQQADQYKALQAHLLKQLPYVPLWYKDHVFAARNNIKGYSLARDGNYDGLIHVTKH